MDAKMAEEVKERLTDLDRRKRDALKRKAEVNGKLDHERNRLYTDETNRKGNLELLAGANDDAMRGYLENEIDGLDESIRSHKRLIEAYEAVQSNIVAELDAIRVRWTDLDKAVVAQERAEKFEAGKTRIAARLADIAEKIEDLDLLLGDEVMDEFQFSEEFVPEGNSFLTFEREKFFQKVNTVGNRLHDVWGWNGGEMKFVAKPMQKNSR
jgi:hypothetical protein